MSEHGITPIDMVIVNLYPFEQTVARPDCSLEDAIENIDIGGPSMLRSSAKNHAYVTIATAPAQYKELMAEMAQNNNAGCTSLKLRRRFASRAFATSAAYDSAIAGWWQNQLEPEPETSAAAEAAPLVVTRAYTHDRKLKYGCNPHQVGVIDAGTYCEARR
jgi:phosphoribosylaminoimidazolecarboxamide formyltransferase/IMP cyclohydrolase